MDARQFLNELLDFDAVWMRLSLDGSCDGMGGREYVRVRQEWIDAQHPHPIDEFIRRHANAGPSCGSCPD